MPLIQKILAPVDFSPHSRRALQYAADLGLQIGATVDVLHMWKPNESIWPDVVIEPEGSPAEKLETLGRIEGVRALDEFVAEVLGERASSVRLRYGLGAPDAGTLTLARDEKIDLIVMGTHGRTGLAHAVLGSVAEKIIRSAPCPVMTLR